MKIYVKHIRQANMCGKGARDFFKRHNLDWSFFLKEGIDEEIILATGDAMAQRVVEVARVRG